MCTKQRKSYLQNDPRLSQRIAEEAQLLAEERWIIDALKKIKSQRNGLQIERLHLESMRSQVVADQNKTQKEDKANSQKNYHWDQPANPESGVMQTTLNEKNIPQLPDMDYTECNTEELNLSVTNSIFNSEHYAAGCDEEEDEEDMENCLIDMDMLMSGK